MSKITLYMFRDFFRESFTRFSQKATLINTASRSSETVTFMKPSTFFGLNLHRNLNIKSHFNTRERLDTCMLFLKQIRSLNQNVLRVLFAEHLLPIASQRVKRCGQMLTFYKDFGYDKSFFRSLVDKRLKNYKHKRDSLASGFFLLGSAMFAWNEENISDKEIDRVSSELDVIKDFMVKPSSDWELMVDKTNVKIWRKLIPKNGLYKYKVCGSYKDISAKSFFQTQVDLEFRRQWDKHVICLSVIDKDDKSGSEIVHWITQFPYPMTSREYLYIRRHKIDPEKKLMVIISRAITQHPTIPSCPDHVRVTDYSSEMVIKPHANFEENGFDYILTYFDDPKSSIPKIAFSWAASSGIPDFVDKLYEATLLLQQKKKTVQPSEVCYKPDHLKDLDIRDEHKLPM